MTRKPVILIIDNSKGITGALRSITQVAVNHSHDFEFRFLIPHSQQVEDYLSSLGFTKLYKISMVEISRRLVPVLAYLPTLFIQAYRLKKICKKDKVDIIHVNDIYNLLPAAARWFGNSTPYVCHVRFLPDRFPKWLFAIWFKIHETSAQAIVAVSNATYNQLPKSTKTSMVYDNLPTLERYADMVRKPTFLYLGNWMRGKGQDFAIRAFSLIHEEVPQWRLRFVGGTFGLKKNEEYKSEVLRAATELGIQNKVDWVEITNDQEKEYREAGVVINFSESESFSMVCMEALFFGCPLIASNCGGPAEIVQQGENGFLVENRNVPEMAKKMKLLAQSEEKRTTMSQFGYKSVREKFSKAQTSEKMVRLYRLTLASA